MNCKSAQRQIPLAVGEDLSPVESQELQGHLQTCSKCQKTWEEQQRGFAVLQRSRTQEVRRKSDSVWPVLANRLRERGTEFPRAEFNGWFAALAVTAACVLVFVFSQEGPVPIASQPHPNTSFGGTMVTSPADLRQTSPPSLERDDVRTRPSYDVAPRPSSDRP